MLTNLFEAMGLEAVALSYGDGVVLSALVFVLVVSILVFRYHDLFF